MKCHNGENWQVWPLLWNMPTNRKGGCEHGHSSSKFVPQLHTNEQNQHQFFATKTLAVVHDHTYSPDFASCGFFSLFKTKIATKRALFPTCDSKKSEWCFWQWHKSVPIV